jgi:uncharacterized protein YueI
MELSMMSYSKECEVFLEKNKNPESKKKYFGNLEDMMVYKMTLERNESSQTAISIALMM